MRPTAVSLLLLAACAGRSTVGPVPAGGRLDLVIEGGRIVDGTGAPWFQGDLGIRDGRIAVITPAGLLRNLAATERIDARGMVVAPGFIDIQSHSRDAFLEGDSRIVSKVTQGITTEIMGEGATNAPQNEKTGGVAAGGATPRHDFSGPRGFARWLEAMAGRGVSTNIGSFLGATTVRMYAKGMAQGAPTPAELDSMRMVVRNAMEDGAFGIASALIYPPGNYATTEELIELARAMAPYGGVYITHMRSEADAWLEAIDEALRIGREGGVPVEIFHLKAGGRRNWDKTAAALAKIDSARAAGQDVQANMYAYVAGGTGLSACLPPWASADGKLFENLRDPATRARIRNEMDREQSDWENLCQLATPDGVLVLGLRKPEHQPWVGKKLGEIATAMGKEPQEAIMDLLVAEEQRIGTVFFMMSEANVATKMRQPWIKFGTDAGGVDPDSARGLVHPRAYGNYPRVLGKYVREDRVLTLEEAVRKASSAVATRLSIHDRGVLKPGLWADVVVFDPSTVSDRATFEQPHQVSVGIRDVFVNGVAVVRNGKHTGAKPGRVVRGPGAGLRTKD
ncbi:MAG TPA: D-aminoacylase [Gemmatimonadales bacterium]|nr:D-aminoacylase [Gemmatimonadales bacterium]